MRKVLQRTVFVLVFFVLSIGMGHTQNFINVGEKFPDFALPTIDGGSGIEDYFVIDRQGRVSFRMHTYNRAAVEAALDDALLTTEISDDEDKISTPRDFSLQQNYPNPFNSDTIINFYLNNQTPQQVVLTIYDLSGKVVRTLVNSNLMNGSYSVKWNGRNDRGSDVASGVYYYVLKSGKKSISRKMTLLR